MSFSTLSSLRIAFRSEVSSRSLLLWARQINFPIGFAILTEQASPGPLITNVASFAGFLFI
jgi:hypothetical protein